MDRSIYRIIDVNFNRGREAGRMIEEFCRFSLNSKPHSSRAKSIRHQLCAAIGKLDADLLLANRDSQTDVGRGLVIDDQHKRGDIKDCFVAACKRLTEALRVLAEVTQTLDPAVAGAIENLRFEAYTLEKDASLAFNARQRYKNVRLYVLITVKPGDSISKISELASKCIKGGADCIQVRAKGLDDCDGLAISKAVTALCLEAGVLSIVNDRVDIATLSGAGGVHFGQGDLTVAQGRSLQVSPLVFGCSTHSVDQLNAAIDSGADYVGIGPVFATDTKPGEKVAGLEYVGQAAKILKDSGVGHAAIGGITLDNVEQVLASGARTIAVCSAITDASDPEDMCDRFTRKILAFR
ncbi:MAG: thiamine phosphate synthase [Planctomycetes bacterium]|nr:thiamine phosphate synthase [Planctomycetota bacterium]